MLCGYGSTPNMSRLAAPVNSMNPWSQLAFVLLMLVFQQSAELHFNPLDLLKQINTSLSLQF